MRNLGIKCLRKLPKVRQLEKEAGRSVSKDPHRTHCPLSLVFVRSGVLCACPWPGAFQVPPHSRCWENRTRSKSLGPEKCTQNIQIPQNVPDGHKTVMSWICLASSIRGHIKKDLCLRSLHFGGTWRKAMLLSSWRGGW